MVGFLVVITRKLDPHKLLTGQHLCQIVISVFLWIELQIKFQGSWTDFRIREAVVAYQLCCSIQYCVLLELGLFFIYRGLIPTVFWTKCAKLPNLTWMIKHTTHTLPTEIDYFIRLHAQHIQQRLTWAVRQLDSTFLVDQPLKALNICPMQIFIH